MEFIYDYADCNECAFRLDCVFDDTELTPEQQDAKCPAVQNKKMIISDRIVPAINTLEWIAFRAKKMMEIEGIIKEEGSKNLKDLSAMLNIELYTLRAWRRWLTMTTVFPIRKGFCSVFVTSVNYDQNTGPPSNPGLKGSANPRTTLTQVQVNAIREDYALGGVTQAELAKQNNISKSSVGAIVRYQVWK